MGDQVEKNMEIPGGRGSNAKPSGTENPVGWGGQTRKTLRGGGMDIFWNHTITVKFKDCSVSETQISSGLKSNNY